MIVYLICTEIDGNNLYKIGYTRRTVEKRIKEFKTGNSSDFYIVDKFESKWGPKIEASLKRIFKEKRINGEWFGLNKSDLYIFKKSCESIHKNLNTIENLNTYYLDRDCKF